VLAVKTEPAELALVHALALMGNAENKKSATKTKLTISSLFTFLPGSDNVRFHPN
jgi:hypothetical protein